ncbi:MAG: hypothetical protein G01um10148_243 [Parcubacteria group bacterium Gr01-1014_8]|nr:MAG: hypothetical protein G01um10148_243 [Parcubacteria group bacterium Gr01-1014_8]
MCLYHPPELNALVPAMVAKPWLMCYFSRGNDATLRGTKMGHRGHNHSEAKARQASNWNPRCGKNAGKRKKKQKHGRK